MRLRPSLTFDDIQKIVAAAKNEASRYGLSPTIAIVDHAGVLLYLERPDTHTPLAIDMSTGKARTAAFRERPSSALEDRVKERPGFLTMPGMIAARGGVPLVWKNEYVGGIGISGIAEYDEIVAKAGAAALDES
jgi:glc operon protein GlcG